MALDGDWILLHVVSYISTKFSGSPRHLRQIASTFGIMDIRLPHLGEGADSGTVVNLFVKEGDRIEKDQPIIELENEKAVATIPSSASGTVDKVFVKTGDKISVGQPILSLSEAGETRKAEPKVKAQPKAKPTEDEPTHKPAETEEKRAPEPSDS